MKITNPVRSLTASVLLLGVCAARLSAQSLSAQSSSAQRPWDPSHASVVQAVPYTHALSVQNIYAAEAAASAQACPLSQTGSAGPGGSGGSGPGDLELRIGSVPGEQGLRLETIGGLPEGERFLLLGFDTTMLQIDGALVRVMPVIVLPVSGEQLLFDVNLDAPFAPFHAQLLEVFPDAAGTLRLRASNLLLIESRPARVDARTDRVAEPPEPVEHVQQAEQTAEQLEQIVEKEAENAAALVAQLIVSDDNGAGERREAELRLSLTTPTGGYELRLDLIETQDRKTIVYARLVPPSPGKLVTQGIVSHTLAVHLSIEPKLRIEVQFAIDRSEEGFPIEFARTHRFSAR